MGWRRQRLKTGTTHVRDGRQEKKKETGKTSLAQHPKQPRSNGLARKTRSGRPVVVKKNECDEQRVKSVTLASHGKRRRWKLKLKLRHEHRPNGALDDGRRRQQKGASHYLQPNTMRPSLAEDVAVKLRRRWEQRQRLKTLADHGLRMWRTRGEHIVAGGAIMTTAWSSRAVEGASRQRP